MSLVQGALLVAKRALGPHALERRKRRHVVVDGTRGAIVMALALSLPLELESWYTLQSMAYGLVLFTLAQHPYLARRLSRSLPRAMATAA